MRQNKRQRRRRRMRWRRQRNSRKSRRKRYVEVEEVAMRRRTVQGRRWGHFKTVLTVLVQANI